MTQFHLVYEQTPFGRHSLRLCGTTVVIHNSREVIARLHNRFRVSQGQAPLFEPHLKPPKAFRRLKSSIPFQVFPTHAEALVCGKVVLLDHDIANLLQYLPGMSLNNGYVTFCFNGTTYEEGAFRIPVYLHRIVMGTLGCDLRVDHINGNRLDCRRQNLRTATPSWKGESPFFGVSRNHGKWKAQLSHEKEIRYLGTFETQEEAAQAYDRACLAQHGEYARLNFPLAPENQHIFLRGIAHPVQRGYDISSPEWPRVLHLRRRKERGDSEGPRRILPLF